MEICANCKYYTLRYAKGLFNNVHKYWVCDNPNTIYQNGTTWWSDGKQITLGEGQIKELLVGCNFGCVNWKEKEDG